MYSITHALSVRCNRNGSLIETTPCKITKVTLAILVTLGISTAAFSAIYFKTQHLPLSIVTSITLLILLGSFDVCITICRKKNRVLSHNPAPIYPEENPPFNALHESDGNSTVLSDQQNQHEVMPTTIEESSFSIASQFQESAKAFIQSVFSNEDLFFEIMKFLDVKDIGKSTLVCKEWNGRIKNENTVLWKYLLSGENYFFLSGKLIARIKQIYLLSTIFSKDSFSNTKLLVATQFLLNNPNHAQRDTLLKKIGDQAAYYEFAIFNETFKLSKKTNQPAEKSQRLEQSPIDILTSADSCVFKNYSILYQSHLFSAKPSTPLILGCAGDIMRASDGKVFYFKISLNIGSKFYIYNDHLIFTEGKFIKFYNIESKVISEHPVSENFKVASYYENKIVLINSDSISKVSKLVIFDIDLKTLSDFTEVSYHEYEKIFMNAYFLVLFQKTKPSNPTVQIWQYESCEKMTIQKTTKLNLPPDLRCIALIYNFLYFEKYNESAQEEFVIVDLNNFKTVGKYQIEVLQESSELK